MADVLSSTIQEILDLRRVPRRMRDRASARLGRLGLAELESRVTQLREQRRAIHDWLDASAREGGAGTCEASLEVLDADSVPSLWDVLASRIDAVKSGLTPEVGGAVKSDVLRQALEMGRRRHLENASTTIASSNSISSYYKDALRELVGDMDSNPFTASSAIAHPVAPHVSIEEFTIGMARLENEISDRQPDFIVGINAQGSAVAQIIKEFLNLQTTVFEVKGAADTHLGNLSTFVAQENCTVCVLGHVLHSGHTMQAVIEEAKTRFRTNRVYGAAIAASTVALDGRLSGSDVIFHQRATSSDVALTLGAPSHLGDGCFVKMPGEGVVSIDEETMGIFRLLARKEYARQKLQWEEAEY